MEHGTFCLQTYLPRNDHRGHVILLMQRERPPVSTTVNSSKHLRVQVDRGTTN